MTMIPSFGVVVLVGLVGLESQGCSRESHPIVGGAICPSRRAVFGRWFTVLVVITWRSYLVCGVAQGWRLLRHGCPLGLASGAGVPIPVKAGVLGGARPLPIAPKGRDRG
jgi:hypothetical protein